MKKKSVDTAFLLTASALVLFGLLIFTSAALGLMARDGGASFASVAVSQLLLGLVVGGILCYVLARVDYRSWRQYTPYLFGFAIVLTILTLVPHIGLTFKGASRWIALGPFSFQPSEILKFATVAFLAAVYAAHYRKVNTWRHGILPLLAIAGSATLLVLRQPDTATAMIIAGASVAVLFTAGGKLSHLGILALVGISLIGVAAYERPYVAERITTFLNQGADPQGAGWQIQQSLISVGSGGLFGRGFGQSIEKFSYLPEPIGDSVFAVVGEEFGFIGSGILLTLFVLFALLGLRIAARTPDPFGGLLAVGIVTLVVGQSFFNIGAALGLVPLAGIPLVFVSHGGTALAVALAEVGVLLSISRRMKK